MGAVAAAGAAVLARQRFGSALNLNIHFHMLFLDGVYVIDETGQKLFSLHAGIDIAPGQRARLERLCRYVSRPPVATERLAMTSSGLVATVRPVTRIGRCRRGALHVLSAIGPNPVGVPINLFKANRWVTGDQLL